MAITTALMMKRVFNLSLRALQGFVDSIFKLMVLPLRCPDYSLVSKRAKSIGIKTPTRGEISHLVIDTTGLKVYGEGEWKARQHESDRRRVWRKLHLAADSATHEITCADLSLIPEGTILSPHFDLFNKACPYRFVEVEYKLFMVVFAYSMVYKIKFLNKKYIIYERYRCCFLLL